MKSFSLKQAAREPQTRSIAAIVLAWLVLHIGCLFTPGLLDDVDSIYIEVAREMNLRHDYVTPFIDGIRFFDKPPLMYWMAAASMRVFGPHDWAARLPLSIMVLALFLSVYFLGKRFWGERGGFYSALVTATSVGPYLFTRFYIPDIMNALWMTFGVHLALIAFDRAETNSPDKKPAWAFAAIMALNLLTKGLIGIVFPLGFVVFYLFATRKLNLLFKLPLISSIVIFLTIALPWHILAALRNPAIAMPQAGSPLYLPGLPAHAGWFWFYVINEHFMRFRGLRIPHDYGQLPIPLFWLMFILWLAPWTVFLPAACIRAWQVLRRKIKVEPQEHEATLSLILWTGMIIGFFTLSSRQEYYSLPALPALALLCGGSLALADGRRPLLRRFERLSTEWYLLPLCVLIALIAGYFALTAPQPPAAATLSDVLTSNPDQYNLALGHLYDLTGRAMGFFRLPLALVAISALGVGPASWWYRRRGRTYAANIVIAVSMVGILLAVHSGLARFYPIIGSKELALKIERQLRPNDRVVLDGELTSGSTLLFYTRHPVSLINGRVNGPWYGSLWPDSPNIFETEDSLRIAWAGPQRIFLLTYNAERIPDLRRFGPVSLIGREGGKMVLTNR
ncbi:MAG: glycosyltransferase family 39 protein [Acidobacteria bacterium]|nr:glycosyltransferase family 39 protein [Acidobacteriota bacterium]